MLDLSDSIRVALLHEASFELNDDFFVTARYQQIRSKWPLRIQTSFGLNLEFRRG